MNAETIQRAREIAAQCWCDPETSGIEMDVRLAEAMAKRIAPLLAAPQAEPKREKSRSARDWATVDAAIREYLDDYEMLGEDEAGADASYTPTQRERDLIYDAINGLLADESFAAAFSAQRREPLTDDWIIDTANEIHAALPFDADEQAELLWIVRAVEREHGIGGSDDTK